MTLANHGRTLSHYHASQLARSTVAIAAVNNNAIIVIGGCAKGGSADITRSSTLTTVELGQIQLIHLLLICCVFTIYKHK